MEKLITAIQNLIKTLVELFGVTTTIWLVVGTVIVLIAWKIYTDIRKRQEVDKALQAKDYTIQLLAEQNREFRVTILKQQGWDDASIDKFILKNTPENPIEARKMLEEKQPAKKKKTS